HCHCLIAVASRFKANRKYVYQYTTESRNGVVGTANLRNGPKVSCQVEIEVPQACRFVMHTRDCALSEVSVMDPLGQLVYRQTPSSDAFQAAMLKNPLKFTVEEVTSVQLYPEEDEPVNILNIKRGIVSALMVPVMEDEENSFMSTVHGQCLTDYLVNARKDIATDVTLSRDLSRCDQFYSRELANSPLALLQKLHRPLSKLITSTQDCNYQFDNKGKHITTAACTEKHIYLPFSHGDNGISSVVTQELIFQTVNPSHSKPLHFEDPDDKAPVQEKDTVLSTLQDLMGLAGTDQGQKRTSLFHKLVSSLRGLTNETLSQTVPEMLAASEWLTWQALFQCGTPECTSAILQAIRTIDGKSLVVDALVYGLSLQANPDAARVRDMLSMAQYKQSRTMMYALANTVKNPNLIYFSNLQVVGVMGEAMQVVSPSLISSILRCAKKTDIPLPNQKAAIQAFRLMNINDEIKQVLMEVYQDTLSPTEKRVAAYLILIRNPDQVLVGDILNNLVKLEDEELQSFVVSHLNNINNSDEPQMQRVREYIELALKDQTSPTNKFDGLSCNYKRDSPFGSIESNIIWNGKSPAAREVMLKTALKAFDHNYDMSEVGVEGAGFEPILEALFGMRGFFTEIHSRVMLLGILHRLPNDVDRISIQDLLKDIPKLVQKLIDDLRISPSPEATAYLKLLGNEIGYLKISDIRRMIETLSLYYNTFRGLPMKVFHTLTSSTENELFAHYIFMEDAFSLPTASGFPLKFSLSGVLAPGTKGGLTHSTDLSFMPSVGLEFITQMGVHIPDYVAAGLEMHTSIFHESSLKAKLNMKRNQMKLSIPAPKSKTQLLSVRSVAPVSNIQGSSSVPSLVEDRTDSTNCQPLVSGLKFCTIVRYSNATSIDNAPYYPLTGETRFAVEIQPTGEVSEYTATITDETLREGKKGRHKIESLRLTLKAEGDDSTEAAATLKYNRNKNVFTTEVVIPDFDVEAGIKLAVTDSDAKGKKLHGITIDVTHKNIPQLTLVGRARFERMKDAMVQLQMAIPALKTNASVTTTLRNDEGVFTEFKTDINLPETSYQEKASLKYDDDKIEAELKSDLNSDIQKLIPNVDDHHRQLQQLIDDILDQKVAKTDMKLRHIVTKGIEAGNIWLDKLTAHMPFFANLRRKRSISDLTFLFRYQFNKEKMAISLPLPLGGKKSEEINFPTTLSVPRIHLPQIGLYIPAKTYPLPSFTIPPSLDFMVPLLGLAEASTKISSNFYTWEGVISGGNSTVDVPSYIAQYKVMGQSPFNLLSYKFEGTGMMSGRADDNLKYLVNTSFSHSLIDTSFSMLETLRVTNKLNAKANYKIEASSPLGLQALIYYSAQATSTLNSDEVSGDGTIDGLLKLGSFYTNTSYMHNYNLRPLDRAGRGESTLHFNSPIIQVHNMIQGVYTNSELKIVSKTNAQNNAIKHVAELRYKDSQLTLKCSAVATAMDKSLNNKVELGVSSNMAILRIESQADDDKNRAYSLITGSLDSNGLEVNSEGSLTFDTGRGLHKASVMVGRNGLTTSGTNSIQCSPVTVENIFNGAIDNNGAYLSSRTKAMQVKTENSHALTLTLWTLNLHSKSNNFICEDIYYKQDTKVGMKPFVMSFDMTNDAKYYDVSLSNEGHVKLQPSKMDLSGSVKGAYGETHNIKHIYEITYGDMAGTMKYSTSGALMDAQLSHSCDIEFAGLSSKSNCDAQINSEPLRFESTIRTLALPFSLNIDVFVNSDGEINLYGKHTGQLYGKYLMKAEPLAFAYLHDSRVSTTHMLQSEEMSTNLDNKLNGLLTPSDQSLTWTLKAKLNNHAYNQDISAYNNPAKIGFEFSGDTFDPLTKGKRSVPEIQGFSMSGFLKYDKNSDCHIIKIPFIENFPTGFEQLKTTLVQALESLQEFINNLDINQVIANFRAMLDQLPIQVSTFMQEMDLENKVSQAKAKLDYLMKEFAVTMDDLELLMNNLRQNLENTVINIATNIRDLLLTVEDYVKKGHLADKIANAAEQVGNKLQAFDEKYDIKQSLVKVLYAIEDIIRQIDLQKITESSAAWLKELDSKYRILEKIKDKLSEIKQVIENFELNTFFQDIRDYLMSVDFTIYVEQLAYKIPSSEIANVIESMHDVIVNWIDEYEIPNKLNAVYFYIRDLLLKYNLDGQFKELMDQAVILIKEFKIKETVHTMVDALKSIKFEYVYNTIMQLLHSLTSQLRAIDFKKTIDDVNKHISTMLKCIKEYDYNVFVNETNKKFAELTNYINKQIKIYEIVQKFEAVREFFREIQNSIFAYLDELKNTKVADALKKLKKVIDTTFYNDIKLKAQDILEDIRQRILDMDIREEIYTYLQRASESYSNTVAFISAQFNQLIEKFIEVLKDNKIITQIKQAVDGVLGALKRAEIEVATFTVPLTDLVVPAFTVNLNKLQDIRIPAQIAVPQFTILNSYTIPALTIDFEEIKAKIVALIDSIREFELQTPDPEEIFGDIKVLYLSDLPDLTLPELTLSEIKFPPIHIPILNLTDFKITMLPIPEIKLPEVPGDICIPVFGKLHGEFRLNSPQYTLVTTGIIENSTSTPKNPQFTATITSHANSPIEPLKYTFEATAQLEAPRMKKLLFTETLKAKHMAFSVDHKGTLTLSGSSAEAFAMTTTKATTQMYTADLLNKMAITLKSGISTAIDTTYNHNMDIPSIEMSSQASAKQNIEATVEAGGITVTGESTGNGKWAIQDYSDEGTHKSNVEVNINFSTAKLSFVGETDCKDLKLKQTLITESVFLSHITVEARCETEVSTIKNSVMVLKAEANIGDLKVALTASHNAEFAGRLIGSMSNLLEFTAHPFQIVLDVTNKVNSKAFLPLKLTGKIDLQHDYGVTINSGKQRTYWFALARFNQYKYKHNFTAENNDVDIFFYSSVNGEANLDFLTVPLSIPEITVPYLKINTPEVRAISLEIKLPTFTLPTIQNNIGISALGNITCDFSFKSTVITISANAGIYNQSDVVARFGASSTSLFDILNGKIDGTTSLTRKRGIKLATTVSVEHHNVEANHECAVSLTKRSMEASVANRAKINLPFLNLELNQELTGNTKTKPNIASMKKMKYVFNIPMIESVGKGNIDITWALEALSSYVLLETSTKATSDITVMGGSSIAGDLNNEASFYLNANGLRSTVITTLNSNINKQEKQKRSPNNILHFNLNKNLALEVSLRRIFATVDYTSNNNVDFASFNTNGRHHVKGELDFVPLTTFKTALRIDTSQPSSLGHAEIIHSINLDISSEKQSFTWSSKKQLTSLIHTCDLLLSNDESEVRMDLTGSTEGYVTFLKSVKLPVYQRTLWDVLKFDQVTNIDNLQFLNISVNILYTKAKDGQEYAIPSKLFENGITFSIPEISLAVPSWVANIPQALKNIDVQFENANVSDHITLPPVISIPAFDVPFTNLQVEPFTIDPKNLNIPKVITSKAFEIMLPGLPVMSVPSYNINTEYLQGKMSFLSFRVPQHEITVSSFTLPKSFTIGEHTISLNEITSQISNFELPAIVIPEQKIEIPEIALHLPSSVFIPSFGMLSATLKVSSPIYNVSTIANMKKEDSSLVTSLNSICSSTLTLLEYNLSGKTSTLTALFDKKFCVNFQI
uniref:Vitellogenin domain-containing protein n=1 Tax=Anabas testudineus TaxID=64144 RepID=A0AAQ6ITG2_ANATE